MQLLSIRPIQLGLEPRPTSKVADEPRTSINNKHVASILAAACVLPVIGSYKI